jgi:hypothetical protein
MAETPGESEFAIRIGSVDDLFEPYDARPVADRPLSYDVRVHLLDEWERTRKAEPGFLTIYAPADERPDTDEGAVRKAIAADLEAASGPLSDIDPLSRSQQIAAWIGIVTLFVCMVISTALDNASSNVFVQALSQAILLLGWVALWDPAARLVTETMPHLFNRRRFAEFSGIAVRFAWV